MSSIEKIIATKLEGSRLSKICLCLPGERFKTQVCGEKQGRLRRRPLRVLRALQKSILAEIWIMRGSNVSVICPNSFLVLILVLGG